MQSRRSVPTAYHGLPRRLVPWTTLLVLALLAGFPSARAQETLTRLTFNELPFQPVDGLSVMGVTFHFQVGGVASTDAYYHGFGPGTITYVQDPSLEGDAAGSLTLDFAEPTALLELGAALSCSGCTLTPGFSVELFDTDLRSLGVTPVNTDPLIDFSEGQFSYSGTRVRRAVITFQNPDAFARFAVDNLTFVRYEGDEISEPSPRVGTGGIPWPKAVGDKVYLPAIYGPR